MRLVAPGDAAAGKVLRAAAANVHTQGVTLPYLVASGDVDGLAAALRDRKLVDAARIGAAEALGRVATEAALAALYTVASSTDEDEELRKAAYRAIRRGHRYEKKRSEKREVRVVSGEQIRARPRPLHPGARTPRRRRSRAGRDPAQRRGPRATPARARCVAEGAGPRSRSSATCTAARSRAAAR